VGGGLDVGVRFAVKIFGKEIGFEITVGAHLMLTSTSYDSPTDLIFAFLRYKFSQDSDVGKTSQERLEKALVELKHRIEVLKEDIWTYIRQKRFVCLFFSSFLRSLILILIL